MNTTQDDPGRMGPRTRRFLRAAGLIGLFICAKAESEILNCTPIPSVPFVISEQGIWCFKGNLSTNITSGYAIEITVNNVTLDLNGYKLGGLAAGPATTATGIHAADRKNISIRNGIVRGFRFGIQLSGDNSEGNLIEYIQAEQNTYTGISVMGVNNTLRNNSVIDTGWSDSSGETVSSSARGIYIGTASFTRIMNNDIAGVRAFRFVEGASASGIYIADSSNSIAYGNRITDVRAGGSSGSAYGIRSDTGVSVQRNSIVGVLHEEGTAYGTYCDGSCIVRGNVIAFTASPVNAYGAYFYGSGGGYRDNVIGGATVDFSGGTDLGGNSTY